MEKQVVRDQAWLAARTTPDGDARNQRLLAALAALGGPLTQQAADAFYDALIDSALIVVTSAGEGGPQAAVAPKGSTTTALSTMGPDGQEWLMAFTDKAHVARRFPQGASVMCLPATAIGEMASKRPGLGGIVLNPGPNNAGGQPIARKGVLALARGLRPDQLPSGR